MPHLARFQEFHRLSTRRHRVLLRQSAGRNRSPGGRHGIRNNAAKNHRRAGEGEGRPPTGKRSNPDWKLYSHFLKRKTQRAAVARLQAEDDGRDLSDVLQELLEDWLKR
jgi:hypothetical protein